MEAAVLDGIIYRLLEVRSNPGKQVQLSESEIKQLCFVSRDIFLRQPNLLELEAPLKICGTLHALFYLIFVEFKYIHTHIYIMFISILFTWFCSGHALNLRVHVDFRKKESISIFCLVCTLRQRMPCFLSAFVVVNCDRNLNLSLNFGSSVLALNLL